MELGILQSDEAYALLCRERKPHIPQEEAAARSIVQRLGRHAMAVDQARAACAAQGFTGFLARLDMDDKQALALSKDLAGDLPNGHERDIAKTFLTSIESLSTEAQDLLTLATLLSNAPISSDLIAGCKLARQAAASQGTGAPDEQAKRKAQLGAEDWAARCMKQLNDCSLADPNAVEPAAPGAPAVPAITVHTLIARVARWCLADGTANIQAKQASQATEPWRQAAVLTLQHALRAATDIRQHAALLHEVQHARQLCEQVETLDQGTLLARIAEYDRARGHYAPAHAAWQIVLKFHQRVLGSEHPDTVSVLGILRHMLTDANDDAGMNATATRYPATRWPTNCYMFNSCLRIFHVRYRDFLHVRSPGLKIQVQHYDKTAHSGASNCRFQVDEIGRHHEPKPYPESSGCAARD